MNELLLPDTLPASPILSVGELMERNPVLNPPVVDGLLRRGEIANLVAAPKVGKTWLAMQLALAVQSGTKWLGFRCAKGNVLYDDLELHASVSASRFPRVAAAMGLEVADWAGLRVLNERGAMRGIEGLECRVVSGELQRFDLSLIVIDAWYRALPKDCDENANGDVMQVYNRLDAIAADLGCAILLVHHTTKGIAANAARTTTDLGAGAGAQSRAADAHIAIRPLKFPGASGISAVVRSWPAVKPFAVSWEFPVFKVNEGLADVAEEYEGRKSKPSSNVGTADVAKLIPTMLDPVRPVSKRELADAVMERYTLSERKAYEAMRRAEAAGAIYFARKKGQPKGKQSTLFAFAAK